GLRRERPNTRERFGGEHRARPRAEVLCGEIFAADLTHVRVDVGGIDHLALAVTVDVPEQLVAGEIAARLHDPREPGVPQADAMLDPALAAEHEAHRRAVDRRVLFAHRRQAGRSILPRVFLVADANERLLEELDDSREHFLARQASAFQIGVGARADARQRARERDETAVLRFVAHFAPARMVAVLLAAARVAAGRLQMAGRDRANPDVGPRGRDRERFDALQLDAIGDGPAGRADVAKTILPADAANAAHPRVVHVAEAGDFCGLDGIDRLRPRRAAPCSGAHAQHRAAAALVIFPHTAPRFWQLGVYCCTVRHHAARFRAKYRPRA